MTTLASALSSNHHAFTAEYNRRGYINNGWDALKRWDGRSTTLVDAGIAGPSRVLDSWQPAPTTAGSSDGCTEGLHLFRYRYLESKTGQVSDPSEVREVTVASGGEQLTFPINTSGVANILRSTDSKVDRIILEMSPVNGDEDSFFHAAEVAQTDSTIVVEIPDAELEQVFLPYPDLGHSPPPLSKYILSHADRLWLYGQVSHAVGTADFTNASVDVDEGATDPDWRESALGTSTVDASGTWFIRKDGDTVEYEVDYYDSGNNKIVLKTAYQGTTTTGSAYTLFNRIDAIHVSSPSYPESFEPLKFLSGPNGEGAGDLTGAVGWGNSIVFYSLNSMFRLTWDLGPQEDPNLRPISNKYGCLNQRVLIEVEGTIYSMDRTGWTSWDGVFPKYIGRGVAALTSQIDFDKSENFHACWFPQLRAIRWFVVYTGDTYPKNYVQYDVDTGTWSTGSYLQGISESRLVPTSDGPQVYYGDENGHTWIADKGTCDGCAAARSHLTVSGVPTTSFVTVTEGSLPTTGAGLTGCYVYHLESGESRLISNNSNDSITVATPFTAAPTAGDTLWVGPFTTKIKTKAWKARRLKKKLQTGYLWIEFIPISSTRYMQVRIYEDHSSTAKTWAAARNNLDGSIWPGSNSDYPTSDWLVDLSESDGNVQIPIGSEWKRYLEIEFEIFEPDTELELISLEHDGQVMGDDQ